MGRALAILVLAGCDAGAPAAKPTPTPPPIAQPPIAHPIDAAAIVEIDVPRPAADTADLLTATPLQPIAAVPPSWERLISLLRIPTLELGRSNGAYMLLARNHGLMFATTFSDADVGEITIGSFRGVRSDGGRAGALLIWIDHHAGRHAHVMACGFESAWSCSAPIPLEDADLKNDLVLALGAEHGRLEIPATAQTPLRRYQIAFP